MDVNDISVRLLSSAMGVNVALRRFLQNHGNIATAGRPESELCPTLMRVHMGPGNYGLFPLHFLPIFWTHYSLFKRAK